MSRTNNYDACQTCQHRNCRLRRLRHRRPLPATWNASKDPTTRHCEPVELAPRSLPRTYKKKHPDIENASDTHTHTKLCTISPFILPPFLRRRWRRKWRRRSRFTDRRIRLPVTLLVSVIVAVVRFRLVILSISRVRLWITPSGFVRVRISVRRVVIRLRVARRWPPSFRRRMRRRVLVVWVNLRFLEAETYKTIRSLHEKNCRKKHAPALTAEGLLHVGQGSPSVCNIRSPYQIPLLRSRGLTSSPRNRRRSPCAGLIFSASIRQNSQSNAPFDWIPLYAPLWPDAILFPKQILIRPSLPSSPLLPAGVRKYKWNWHHHKLYLLFLLLFYLCVTHCRPRIGGPWYRDRPFRWWCRGADGRWFVRTLVLCCWSATVAGWSCWGKHIVVSFVQHTRVDKPEINRWLNLWNCLWVRKI